MRGTIEVERVIHFCTGMVLNKLRAGAEKWTRIQ